MTDNDETETAPETAPDSPQGERIAKVLARAGLCSRREAERWIEQGRVAVDGKVLTTPAVTVTPDNLVVVDGKPLPAAEETRLWRYNKPDGLVTSHRDPEGRPTVFDKMPPGLPRVISIGRLDITSEGLLLLTNDGALARRLELPATAWVRRYRVRAYGPLDDAHLTAGLAGLAKGVTIDGVAYGPITAHLDSRQGGNVWLTLALQEGKNREVRKVLEHLGLTVNRLIRVSYGPFHLGNLGRGEVEEVPRKALREQLGLARPGQAEAKKKPTLRPKGALSKKPPRRRPERDAEGPSATRPAGKGPGAKFTGAKGAKRTDAKRTGPDHPGPDRPGPKRPGPKRPGNSRPGTARPGRPKPRGRS